MSFVSRGFRGRRRDDGRAGRVPPGQHLTGDFPVLSAGPTPHTPLAEWTFSITGEVEKPRSFTWDEAYAVAFCDGGYTTTCPSSTSPASSRWGADVYLQCPGVVVRCLHCEALAPSWARVFAQAETASQRPEFLSRPSTSSARGIPLRVGFADDAHDSRAANDETMRPNRRWARRTYMARIFPSYRFHSDESGQTMAEYGVVLAVVTLGVILALTALAGGISGAVNSVVGAL